MTPGAGNGGSISPSTPQTVPTLGGVTFIASSATLSAATQSAMAMDADNGYVVDQWLVNGIPAQSGGTNFTLAQRDGRHGSAGDIQIRAGGLVHGDTKRRG